MKISKNVLRRLIENYLIEAPEYYSVTSGTSDFEGVDKDIKEFLRLVGYVCVYEIMKIPSDDIDVDPQREGRLTIQVTSGRRSGMAQMNAWLEKINSGESKEETLELYGPGDDPFMSKETLESAATAYKMLTDKLKDLDLEENPTALVNSSEIKDIAKWVENNPFSSHLSGDALDLRAKDGKGKLVLAALKYIKDNKLARFHFQEELKPHHIHLGPAWKGQDFWLTLEGYSRLARYDRIDSQRPRYEMSPGMLRMQMFER